MEQQTPPAKVSFDFSGFMQKYGTWVIVGGVALYVLLSVQKKGDGGKGRPKVD